MREKLVTDKNNMFAGGNLVTGSTTVISSVGHQKCTYPILYGYPHIKPRDHTRLTQKSCENLCNLVVPTTRYPSMYQKIDCEDCR